MVSMPTVSGGLNVGHLMEGFPVKMPGISDPPFDLLIPCGINPGGLLLFVITSYYIILLAATIFYYDALYYHYY